MVTIPADLLDCGIRSESVTGDGDVKQTTSQWPSIANGSPYISPYASKNWQLLVFLRDSTVAFVQLIRFSVVDSFVFGDRAFFCFYEIEHIGKYGF